MKNKSFNVPQVIKTKILEVVLKRFGLKDFFQLRDRIDGLDFFNKYLYRIYSIYVCEQIFGIELINKKRILSSSTSFYYNSKNYITTFTTDIHNIKIPNENFDNCVVVKVTENSNKANYLGYISMDECIRIKSNLKDNSYSLNKFLLKIKADQLT